MEPLFTVGGIASGLDTSTIISQMIDIERIPIQRLEARKSNLDTVDRAWQGVSSKLSGLRSVLDGLRQATDWSSFTTASSSSDAVSVTASGASATPGQLTFTVESLATSHREVLAGTFSSLDDLVGAGTFTLTDDVGAELVSITTDGTTTLRNLVSRIDAAGVGVDAQALQVSSGSFRLVLGSTATGLESAFGVTTDIAALGASSTVSAGADAHLTIGSLDVYRSSNTVADLVEGVTIDLKSTSATPVTVTTGRDVDAAVEAVTAFVAAINGVLGEVKAQSAYNAESKTAKPLQGDSTARALGLRVRSAISGTINALAGAFTHAGAVGLSLTRDGAVSLDAEALRDALNEDFDAVAGVFAQNLGSDDDRVSFGFAGDATAAGSYDVVVTQAARVAAITGATYSPPGGSPKVFTITTSDGTNVEVTIDDGMSVDQAVARINAALQAAATSSPTASVATLDDGMGGTTEGIRLEGSRYGAAHSFTVSGYGGDLDGTHTGQDVAGTIDGVAAVGTGRSLRSASGASSGLGLTITASEADVAAAGGTLDLGTVSYSSGIGGSLDRVLEEFEGIDGSIQRARDLISGQKRLFDDQIEAYEVRVALREVTLRRKFAGLESTLGTLQAQGNWLSGQLGSLTSA